MLRTEVVDTRGLPPAERFDFWHQLVAQETAPAHISSAHLDDFVAEARVVDLGRIRMTALRYPSLYSIRPERLVRQHDAEVYQLALPTAGRSVLSQDRRQAGMEPAEFTLLDVSRPHVAVHDAVGAGLAATITVQIPHRELPIPPDRVRRLLATRIPTDAGIAALAAQYLRRIAAHPEQYHLADAPALAAVALDLISATLARQLDGEPRLPVEVRQNATRAEVTAFVERHLADRELTPAAVAAAHHLSLRALHRLFADADLGVAALIRTRRLERCRRDLANPLLADQPVQVIAARWGFADKAHFSRLFRATYGQSPRAYRSTRP
ncbi:helix-turn-helix domain-containing protein [Micromonospora sp. CPCC 205711]|uniref:AraC-like ligand-binding domain-containing protein n=1 Tax=Micromonospora sp. CPCC 205547 TaxID=3122400 RepID=UPI002FF0FA41